MRKTTTTLKAIAAGFMMLLCCHCTNPSTTDQPIEVETNVHETTELMSVVMRLSGADEYNWCEVESYAEEVDSTFASLKDHKVVQIVKGLQNTGFRFDMPMNTALRLIIKDGHVMANPEVGEVDYEGRLSAKKEEEIIRELDSFYQESHFSEFFASHKPLYDRMIEGFEHLKKDIDFSWFDSFFGPAGNRRFAIALSILNGPANFASSINWKDGSKTMNCTLGCAIQEEDGSFSYDWIEVAPVVIHEFCHSYCNPLNEKYWESMRQVAETRFAKDSDFFASEAYPDATFMMNESFVWASVLKYLESHPMEFDFMTWDEVKEVYHQDIVDRRRFTLVPSMLEALSVKEQGDYADMDAFMPQFCSMLHE